MVKTYQVVDAPGMQYADEPIDLIPRIWKAAGGSFHPVLPLLRHGSNGLDSSSPTKRPSLVILSAAKDLAADRDRPFAEFTLERSEGLRVT